MIWSRLILTPRDEPPGPGSGRSREPYSKTSSDVGNEMRVDLIYLIPNLSDSRRA